MIILIFNLIKTLVHDIKIYSSIQLLAQKYKNDKIKSKNNKVLFIWKGIDFGNLRNFVLWFRII